MKKDFICKIRIHNYRMIWTKWTNHGNETLTKYKCKLCEHETIQKYRV